MTYRTSRETRLISLLRSIKRDCFEVGDLIHFNQLDAEAMRTIIEKEIGLAFLKETRAVLARFTAIVGEPIENADKAHQDTSPWRSKKDPVNFLTMSALSHFYSVRKGCDRPCDTLLLQIERRILNLPPPGAPGSVRKWTSLICKSSSDGAFWAKSGTLSNGGEVYNQLASLAVRNRRGKLEAAFKRTFGLSPTAFLKQPYSERRQNGQLFEGPERGRQSVRAIMRAERLRDGLTPSPKEMKAALAEAVGAKVKTFFENLPQAMRL